MKRDPIETALENQDLMDEQESCADLLLPPELSEALFDADPNVIEFILTCRAGESPPLDLAARLMERGIDVESLEASITP